MALATVGYAGQGGGAVRFRVDIGSNSYFSYAIGDEGSVSEGDDRTLADPKFASEIEGPLPSSALGRTWIEVPAHLFNRKARFFQVCSFRTRDRRGPAFSDIVHVPIGGAWSDDLPGTMGRRPLARSSTLSTEDDGMSARVQARSPVAFRLRERPMSSAMFLESLTSILNGILPVVRQAIPVVGQIGNLFGGGQRSNQPNVGAAALGQGELLRLIQQLLQQLGGLDASRATPPTTAALSFGAGYSEAQFAPALLAALPALAQLLQQVLSPDTIRAITERLDPSRVIGSVTDGIAQLGRLGLQNEESLRNFIRSLNPGVEDPSLNALLREMSINLSLPENTITHRRVESVKLGFVGPPPIRVADRHRIAFRAGRDIAFDLHIEAPRSIPPADLLITVKDPATLGVFIRRRIKLARGASPGLLAPRPFIPAASLARLRPGHDYLLTATLVWKNKQKNRVGTSVTQLVTLVGEYIFDRVEDTGEVHALNDVDRHRPFWHKIWQESLTDEVRSFDLECKYYYAVDPGAAENARMATVTQTDAEGAWARRGRMKSGLVLGLATLNGLLPSLGDLPPLSEPELDALRGSDFTERFNQAARTRIHLRGRPGDSVAVWVYPEAKLARIFLRHVRSVDDAGRVTDLSDHPVVFPIPSIAHFVGASSQS